MRLNRIVFIVSAMVFFCQIAAAQSLPAKAKSYLSKNYSGWKLTTVARLCSRDFSRSVVVGDFDGDGRSDYAIKFTRGGRGYILALLDRKPGYEAHVLVNRTAATIRSTGLSIARKGDEYPIGGEYPEFEYGRLPNDAPMIGPCASEAEFVVYKNGKFQ